LLHTKKFYLQLITLVVTGYSFLLCGSSIHSRMQYFKFLTTLSLSRNNTATIKENLTNVTFRKGGNMHPYYIQLCIIYSKIKCCQVT